MNKKFRLAIFASGNGTNAEAIMKYFRDNDRIEVAILMSNNPHAFALDRAQKLNVPTFAFDKRQFHENDEVLNRLKELGITHLVLAGFLLLIPNQLIDAFADRIINIHPSLLPKFGGKGMYGMKVHEAVKAEAEKESGITIHEVNAKYDEGKILFQTSCQLSPEDSAEAIQAKVNALEYEHYPRIIEQWILPLTPVNLPEERGV